LFTIVPWGTPELNSAMLYDVRLGSEAGLSG